MRMISNTLPVAAAVIALATAFAFPAHAGVSLKIDDRTETLTATPGFGLDLTQEGIGILGDASYHFEYFSTDPTIPAPGVARTFNVNWWEDFIGGAISDTLSVTITGHAASDSNVSVDLSFLSDSLDEISPAALGAPNVNIVEPIGFVTYNPLSDLNVTIGSRVPEPATLTLFSGALAGLGFARRKGRKRGT